MTTVTLSLLPNFKAKSHNSSEASLEFFPPANAVRTRTTASVLDTTSHKPSDAMIRNSSCGDNVTDLHSGTGITWYSKHSTAQGENKGINRVKLAVTMCVIHRINY